MTTLSIDLQYHFDLYSLPAVPEGLFAKKISVSYDEEPQEKTNWYFIQYVKHLLCETTYRTHGLFRSVLTDGKKIHVFSPPKSIPFYSSTISLSTAMGKQRRSNTCFIIY